MDVKELVCLVNEEMDVASAEYRDRLESVSHQIKDANRRLERLYDVLETGKVSLEDLSPRVQQHRDRLRQLQGTQWELEAPPSNRRIELADDKTVKPYVEDLRELLSNSPQFAPSLLPQQYVLQESGENYLQENIMPTSAWIQRGC